MLSSTGQLIINVSRGTEQASVYQQTISGNTSTDSVFIHFVTPRGDSIHQVTDLKNRVVITVATIPGEQELGEPAYQVLCFISAHTGDMIPSEAVTKLRQKHSATVRVAEEHKGTMIQDNPVRLVYSRSSLLSPHIPTVCREAKHTTYSSEEQLRKLVNSPARLAALIDKGAALTYNSAQRCPDVMYLAGSGPCVCTFSTCVWWYPCTLKFCRSAGGETEHRCGIRTCSQCTTHRFLVNQTDLCSWDSGYT